MEEFIGYLIVNVRTARGAIPLADATVHITPASPERSGEVITLRTNLSGATERVALTTVSPSLSMQPGSTVPYSLYNIAVSRDGFYAVNENNVQVFPRITSIQPVNMIPLAERATEEGVTPEQNYIIDESPSQQL